MKRGTRDLLRHLVKRLDNEVVEMRGNIVALDELTAQRLRRHDDRLTEIEAALADNDRHSVYVDTLQRLERESTDLHMRLTRLEGE